MSPARPCSERRTCFLSCLFAGRAHIRKRRGVITVLMALLMVAMLGMLAFSVDIGYMYLAHTQVQNAADSAALAAASCVAIDQDQATGLARQFAGYNKVGSTNVVNDSVNVEFGTWDSLGRAFTLNAKPGNAVRVTVQRDNTHGGEVGLFFAPIFGKRGFQVQSSAVAMTNPRDIAFVIDLSGSMNNDSEPCWATQEIDNAFSADGYPTVGDDLMQQVFDDFTFGTFPGTLTYVGQGLTGVAADQYAYAEMTKDSGPLTQATIAAQYRIANTDSEATRKQKAYKWIIDNQIAVRMPNAKPTANSSDTTSYSYWEKYLDYIMLSQKITSTSAKGRPRPAYSVTLPPNQASNRIDGMSNPYPDAFPDATSATAQGFRNQIGYRTYVQFMMDFGRDVQVAGRYTPLSTQSPDCPWHSEVTDGGTFSFPPREQATHAARRAIIAAIQVIKDRNQGISDPNQRDCVSVVTFDTLNNVQVVRNLTSDYDAAMRACTGLQAVSDTQSSTATETGLIVAKNHISSIDAGGQGRRYTNKVIVLLTDGIPNLSTTSDADINTYVGQHPSTNFYDSGQSDKNAALMQCMAMQANQWYVFPVGIGLGCNYDFMDRSARMGGTANKDGQGSRGSGNPAQYEERLKSIFQNIITNPKARLVQ